MTTKEKESWLTWFRGNYGDKTTGLAVDSKDDMDFARNEILCGVTDALERIATVLENEYERHSSL